MSTIEGYRSVKRTTPKSKASLNTPGRIDALRKQLIITQVILGVFSVFACAGAALGVVFILNNQGTVNTSSSTPPSTGSQTPTSCVAGNDSLLACYPLNRSVLLSPDLSVLNLTATLQLPLLPDAPFLETSATGAVESPGSLQKGFVVTTDSTNGRLVTNINATRLVLIDAATGELIIGTDLVLSQVISLSLSLSLISLSFSLSLSLSGHTNLSFSL